MQRRRLALGPVLFGLLAGAGCAPAAPPAVASTATSSVRAPVPLKPTPSPALLILAKRDETLSIVNPATLEIVRARPGGPRPA